MPSLAVNGVVLRHANYRDNDRMLTLLTPDHGRVDVLARGCRRPRSPLLSASEMFCTGEYLLFTQRDRATLTGCTIHDSFYPLRLDFDRLSYGVYLLNLCEAAAQPEQPCPELFWLLIRFLSRLSYDEPRYHSLAGAFLLHYADQLGYKPRLRHCVKCGRRLEDAEPVGWDEKAGGFLCRACLPVYARPLPQGQPQWLRSALTGGPDAYLTLNDADAPFALLKNYVESRLDKPIKSGAMLV